MLDTNPCRRAKTPLYRDANFDTLVADVRLVGPDASERRTELAHHLEDAYEAGLRAGLSEADAMRHARALIPDPQQLSQALACSQRSDHMSSWKTVLLPGLAGVAGAASLLAVSVGVLSPAWWASENPMVHVAAACVALGVFAACGAAAAAWSRRSGGTRADQMLAAGMPVMLQAALVAVALMADALAQPGWPAGELRVQWGLVIALLLVPGSAIMAGAWPLLRPVPARARATD